MKKLFAIAIALLWTAVPDAYAVTFMADTFSYDDGQLTDSDANGVGGAGANVGGGVWAAHSGANGVDEWVDIVSGQAELLIDGSEDVNRGLGTTMGAGDTWYFASTVTVNDIRADPENDALDNEYFIHFMAGSFDLRARVYIDDPNAADPGNYTFGLSATSGGQFSKWATDYAFGSTHTVVASYDFDTGDAELWIDPVDSSSDSITDLIAENEGRNENSPMTPIEGLGLRQASNSNNPSHQILVDAVSAADSFADALAALGTDFPNTGSGDPDIDGDLDVDGQDFLQIQRDDVSLIGDWVAAYPVGVPAIASVPEPTSIALIGLAVVLAPLTRRQRG